MEDLGGETERWKPRARPLLITIAINILLGGLLLGVPFARGRSRAEESRRAFAGFAACFFDARARSEGGLALPVGDRARFATLALRGPADWPERCIDELAAVAPEAAIFVFPGVKDAEARVRLAVDLVDRELSALSHARAAGERTVPLRPLRAVEALRATLAEQALAAGFEIDATQEAVALGEGPDLPTPSLVPLRVATGGRWSASLDRGVLAVSALDSRAVGRVRVVEGGQVDLRVARRPRLASALIAGPVDPWVVWSTPADQCDREPQGCLRRAIGLAAFVQDRQELAPQVWLGAHPALPSDQAVRLGEGVAFAIALAEEGSEVRRFALPEAQNEPPHLDPDARWALPFAPIAVAWLDGHLAALGPDGAIALALEPDAQPAPIEVPSGLGALAGCGAWAVFASEQGSVVRRADGLSHALADLSARPVLQENLRVVCAGDEIDVWAIADGALRRATCGEAGCGPARSIASSVLRFDAARLRGRPIAAISDAELESAIRVVVGDEREVVPAACFDPEEGLCGEPRLVSSGDHAFLIARQGADLRAIETDDGETWRPLPGLGDR